MNRHKLLEMTMKRIRLLLFASFVVAVTALSWGITPTFAGVDPAAAKRAAEKDALAAKRAAAATRARTQRDAAIKKRHDVKKYMQTVVEGQQAGGAQ